MLKRNHACCMKLQRADKKNQDKKIIQKLFKMKLRSIFNAIVGLVFA